MPQFFIDRPVFAWVLAILITLGGTIAILNLPIEAYPTIAPPSVQIRANYPGANAQVVQSTVTQVIEQNLSGIDHLLYFRDFFFDVVIVDSGMRRILPFWLGVRRTYSFIFLG